MLDLSVWDWRWESAWPAILAAAGVTYLIRVSGYWLMGQVPIGPRMTRALDALPGSIFVAAVLPIAVKAGPPGIAAALASGLAMLTLKKDWAAIFLGLAAGALMRAAGF
jgi:uncharacterized membrane protein